MRLQRVRIREHCNAIDRFKLDTMKKTMDLKPEGMTHPNCLAMGTMGTREMLNYNDLVIRLEIYISGDYNRYRRNPSWEHIGRRLEARYSVPNSNRLVDWITASSLNPV